MTRHTGCSIMVATLVVLLFAVSGCGSSETHSMSAVSDSTSAAPVSPKRSTEATALDGVENRLRAAGLATASEAPGDAQGALNAGAQAGNEPVAIAYYRDAHQAAVVGDQISQTFGGHPGNGLSAVRGHLLLYVANENGLTANEKAIFKKVVAIAGTDE